MKFIRRWMVLALLLFAPTLVNAQPPTYTDVNDPVSLVTSYYNAINLKDYARAYGYWETAPGSATLAQFTQGFSTTASVQVYVRLPVRVGVATGNLYADIAVLLISTHTDNTPHIYTGCVTAHKVNVPVGNATEPDPAWHLYRAVITSRTTVDFSLLETACEQKENFKADYAYEYRESPADLLSAYFNAIARKEYSRAYGYWESAPGGATLDQYTQGFARTADMKFYVNLNYFIQGAAGSMYTSIPAILNATLTDGTQQIFVGCYTLRKSNVPVGSATEPDPNWSLYSAKVSLSSSFTNARTILGKGC